MTTPTRTILVVGAGPVADATTQLGAVMGWKVEHTDASAAQQVSTLGPDDAVVVLSHDPEVDGPTLAAAVASDVGYVGAMGSRRTQERRREWLAGAGVDVDARDRIHGPAGLDIGADTPAEIALAVVAQVVALARGASGVQGVDERGGPIHPDKPEGGDCPCG
ncbi:XdhC family protein [Solicola sp. PLA-1-18]|uniref:XdhC family protein n=1 Tax=Solicola sp. PLA-1-18 TaxID=3380532 RepID=UPI003B804E63